MLVGDIYGGRDYASVGLSASTIASSFGKVVGQDKELGDYNPAGVLRFGLCVLRGGGGGGSGVCGGGGGCVDSGAAEFPLSTPGRFVST
jgi:hypothetical protein